MKTSVSNQTDLFGQSIVKPKKKEMKTYAHKEVIARATDYFKGDEMAASVWLNKYALKDSVGNIYELTPDDMHERMAVQIHKMENKYPNPMSKQEIFDLLKDFKYVIPQGGSMAGIGNQFQIASLSNCFVIGNRGNSDSYGGIMKTDEEQVQLMKRRGGVGHDLSHIRPKGAKVQNSALTATGIVPFMERYSNSTREVAQDGRRGALMLSISSRHPDVEDFIDAKMEEGKITGANVSVKIDDAFMQAVEDQSDYQLKYPIQSPNPQFDKSINAAGLWKKIVHNAWKSAEPGILFWDTVINESIPDCYKDMHFETVSTNPCGEIPLCPYDSCRLVALNLYSYVDQPFTAEAYFDFEKFKLHVNQAQRIMDDIIDLEIHHIDTIIAKIESDPQMMEIKRTELNLWKKIKAKCQEGRRSGLGITAEGDMLAALGLQYGSDDAMAFSTEVQKTLALEAYRSTVTMAKERGSFPIYDASLERGNPFIKRIKEADEELYQEMITHGRRNIALLTIAPTGTTSMMSQTTSGIEPVFKISYKRRKKVNPSDKDSRVDFVDQNGDSWQEYHVLHHKFKTWLDAQAMEITEVEKMTDDQLNELINKSPYHLSTAEDIDWVSKVKMQGQIQKWVDHSISVTVNVPENTPEEVISDVYMTAWKSGCKGVTVYREGSRSGVLVSNDTKEESAFEETKAPKRPQELEAKVIRFNNNDEKWVAVVGMLNDRPYEIFTGKLERSFQILSQLEKGVVIKCKNEDGSSRYDFKYQDEDGYNVIMEGLSRTFDKEYWNYAKLISGILRHGMPVKYVVAMVDNLHLSDDSLNTWKKGVIRALSKFIPNGTKPNDTQCKECGEESLVYEEGCLTCKSCGYSRCG